MTDPDLEPVPLLPLRLEVATPQHLFGGGAIVLTLHTGLTVLLGPNGTGKTQVLRGLKPILATILTETSRQLGRRMVTRYLAAGRSAPFERFRGPSDDPHGGGSPAAVGFVAHLAARHNYESLIGDVLALQVRTDLRVKVEARLHALFRRRLRLQWTQAGVQVAFVSSHAEYSVTTEASGVLHMVGLLAAIYDDEVGAILIDEPEISLHPQLQAFLLEEIRRIAGDPVREPGKKLIVLSTHAQGMLPLRRIAELPNLVFFTDAKTAPLQISPDIGELKGRALAALVARLGESHRTAFFAPTVLLVEGPSDEMVVSALAAYFNRSLAGAGAQIVPVIGKGEIPETARLFRLMGKRVIALADLDALADDNALVTAFAGEDSVVSAATTAGHRGVLVMDNAIRTDFARAVEQQWDEIKLLAASHRYMRRSESKLSPEKDKRRAALAVVLTADQTTLQNLAHGHNWVTLRDRFDALLRVLAAGGCFLLRRGTIEDCYLASAAPADAGKPEAAAAETAAFAEAVEADLRRYYADPLRAIECAAPAPPVNENAFLRGILAGLLGTVFQALEPGTTSEDLANIVLSANPDAMGIFALENASAEHGAKPAVRVRITSTLFSRDNFPAVIRRDQSLHEEVASLLS